MKRIQEKLFSMQDATYRMFHAKLIPTVDPETIIGVRTPRLRQLAKELKGSPEAEEFLRALPHRYYEENNLHGFLIEQIKDYDECVAEMDLFLPYVDNWATCDGTAPKVFIKNRNRLLQKIKEWIVSEHLYTVRYAIKTLMSLYLDEYFEEEHLQLAAVQSEEYYIRMAVAWYFATALAKQYDKALPYLTERRLDPWVHRKTIQKAIESNRISEEQKAYLRTLK